MEQENFSQRRARLIELQRRRGGKERDVPKRRPAKAVFGKCPQCGAVTPKSTLVRAENAEKENDKQYCKNGDKKPRYHIVPLTLDSL